MIMLSTYTVMVSSWNCKQTNNDIVYFLFPLGCLICILPFNIQSTWLYLILLVFILLSSLTVLGATKRFYSLTFVKRRLIADVTIVLLLLLKMNCMFGEKLVSEGNFYFYFYLWNKVNFYKEKKEYYLVNILIMKANINYKLYIMENLWLDFHPTVIVNCQDQFTF